MHTVTVTGAAYLAVQSHPRPDTIGIVAAALTAVLITVAAILLTYLVLATRLLVKLPRAAGVLGAHEFAIDADGLRKLTAIKDTRVAWGHATQVFRTRTFVFILVRKPMLWLIPRRAFADTAADTQFWNALQPLAAQKEK